MINNPESIPDSVTLPPEAEINEMEEDRLSKLESAGIDEASIIDDVTKAIGSWRGYWTSNQTRGQDDIKFLYQDQWNDRDRSEFKRLFKPAMQFNVLKDPVTKILAEQRKNDLSAIVRSQNGSAPQEVIDNISTILELIGYNSNAQDAYNTACDNILTRSFGAYEIYTEYESPDSFQQTIKIRKINDPEKCFFDPRAVNKAKDDGDFCGKYTVISREQFISKYPNIPLPSSFTDLYSADASFRWYTAESVTIAEYFVKEWTTDTLYELDSGETIRKSEYDSLVKLHKQTKKTVSKSIDSVNDSGELDEDKIIPHIVPELPKVIRERFVQDCSIMHYLCTRDKILDFTPWPAQWFGLIYVDGDSRYIDGQQVTSSFIREAKDAQKFLNYLGSEAASQIRNMQRTRYLATPANIAGFQKMWSNPELQTGALLYNPDDITQREPIVTPASEIPQSLFIYFGQMQETIKGIIGFYDVNRGADSAEVSGVAIQNRSIQGSQSAFIFMDNLSQAIQHGFKVILDLIPSIYDTERVFSTRNDEGTISNIVVNKKMPDGSIKNPINKETFKKMLLDVEVKVGSSSAAQKQQAMTLMTQLVQVYPQVAPFIIDLYVKNIDLQSMPVMLKRLKSLVPPQAIAAEKGLPPPPQQPDPQAQLLQVQSQMAQQEMHLKQENLGLAQQKFQHEQQMDIANVALKKADLELQSQNLLRQLKESKEQSETEILNTHLNTQADIVKDQLKHAHRVVEKSMDHVQQTRVEKIRNDNKDKKSLFMA